MYKISYDIIGIQKCAILKKYYFPKNLIKCINNLILRQVDWLKDYFEEPHKLFWVGFRKGR